MNDSGIKALFIQNRKNGVETTTKKGYLGPNFVQLYTLKPIVNPPKEKPNSKKDHKLTSPRYSGEKNRNGTPKLAPNDSKMMAKSKAQYKSPKKLYFR